MPFLLVQTIYSMVQHNHLQTQTNHYILLRTVVIDEHFDAITSFEGHTKLSMETLASCYI